VQLTPPGSECSIQIGTGITRVKPGTCQEMYLIVPTRAELVDRGVVSYVALHLSHAGRWLRCVWRIAEWVR
jgi:hypothetical protein